MAAVASGRIADEPVPVVLDQNTAMYSLRLYGGVGQTFDVTYADGTTVKFRVAGLLANSVLQGNLLIGEGDFQRLFPQISGYRFFLIRSPPGKSDEVARVLEDRLGDEGFDAVDARARLADLLAVQNTYISTFQSLGALGLVLGTFGLAAVQLRSVFERRKELALMRATGFRAARLGEMVLLENLLLLGRRLGVGTLAALVAVLPQMLSGGAAAAGRFGGDARRRAGRGRRDGLDRRAGDAAGAAGGGAAGGVSGLAGCNAPPQNLLLKPQRPGGRDRDAADAAEAAGGEEARLDADDDAKVVAAGVVVEAELDAGTTRRSA